MQNVLDWAARGTRPSIANRMTHRFRKATLRGISIKTEVIRVWQGWFNLQAYLPVLWLHYQHKELHNVRVIYSYAIVMQLGDLHSKTKAHHGPIFRPLSSSNFMRQDSMVDEMLHGPSPNRYFRYQSFRTSMRAHQIACVTCLAV